MMRIFGMMILTMDLAALVDSYSIDYFDCRAPKGKRRYEVSPACEEERMNDPAKQTYYLLHKEIRKILLWDISKPKIYEKIRIITKERNSENDRGKWERFG